MSSGGDLLERGARVLGRAGAPWTGVLVRWLRVLAAVLPKRESRRWCPCVWGGGRGRVTVVAEHPVSSQCPCTGSFTPRCVREAARCVLEA